MMTLNIQGFVAEVLQMMNYRDIDGGLEEAALKYGLIEERPATAEDCESMWRDQGYEYEVGEPMMHYTDALKEYLK